VYGLTKGPVLGDPPTAGSKAKARRDQQRHRDPTSSRWRCKLGATFVARIRFSGRQGTARYPIIKAGDRAPGAAAFIDVISHASAVQQPPRLHEELRLRAALHNEAGESPRLHHRPPSRSRVSYEPGTVEIVEQHGRIEDRACASSISRLQHSRQRSPAMSFLLHHAGRGADRHRSPLRGQTSRTTCTAISRPSRTPPQCAGREGAVSGLIGARNRFQQTSNGELAVGLSPLFLPPQGEGAAEGGGWGCAIDRGPHPAALRASTLPALRGRE